MRGLSGHCLLWHSRELEWLGRSTLAGSIKRRNHLTRKRKKKVLEKERGKAAVIRKTIKMSWLHVELG